MGDQKSSVQRLVVEIDTSIGLEGVRLRIRQEWERKAAFIRGDCLLELVRRVGADRDDSDPVSAAAALFGGFAGTTKRSDCPCPFISGLPPRRSLSGPPGDQPGGRARALPVLAHGGSVHALVL